jgi:hypothetical protein
MANHKECLTTKVKFNGIYTSNFVSRLAENTSQTLMRLIHVMISRVLTNSMEQNPS